MIILGSTGSIGVSALRVAEQFSLHVELLAGGSNVALLNEQIVRFRPRYVVVANPLVSHNLVSGDYQLFLGEEGLLQALEETQSTIVLNAIVGFAGLKPTLKALALGKKVALANKESLVVAGEFINTQHIVPVDSEHFGLWYLLGKGRHPKKMVITASGGALRDRELLSMDNATLDDVLKHPNWQMGQKITIDSATMMNKLFEILEARWLFGETIHYDAIIETSSTIHAFVEFSDGVTTAQLSPTDMRLPIAYALLSSLDEPLFSPLDLSTLSTLSFRQIDTKRYPLWALKEQVLTNPSLGVVLNALNEVAIEKFVQRQCSYREMNNFILDGMEKYGHLSVHSLDDVFGIDAMIRA